MKVQKKKMAAISDQNKFEICCSVFLNNNNQSKFQNNGTINAQLSRTQNLQQGMYSKSVLIKSSSCGFQAYMHFSQRGLDLLSSACLIITLDCTLTFSDMYCTIHS